MNSPLNSSWPRLALFCLGALLAFSVACNRGPSQPGAATGQPAAKRYSLKGRVISVDKNGKRISPHQYRGQTLLLTLIYTRCPFPNFCPRVSHEFAAIDGQVRADPARYGRTHLLSISFDPAHDTPKVLRAYGFSCAVSKDSALFTHWEFSTIPPAE